MPSLEWIGKDKIVTHHQDVPVHELVHQYGYTAGGKQSNDTGSGNMIIHGDNLVALKSLLPKYEGRVDLIYIDPPYNTGNENWVYNDSVNDPRILAWLGKVVGKEGEDFTRHDKWLCMMYPRLQLMRKLLSENGVIYISIDDNEVANLRKICDEIFGSNCFKGDIIWHKTYSPRNDSKGIPTETDHILVYSKSKDWLPKRLERDDEMDDSYKNPDNDVAPWTSSDAFASEAATHQGMVYAIQHPLTGELIYPYQNGHWRYSQDQMLRYFNGWCEYELVELDDAVKRAQICGVPVDKVRTGVYGIVLKNSLEESREAAQKVLEKGPWPRFYFTNNGLGGIRRKTYLNAVEGKLITTFWDYEDVGHTDRATKEIKAIFGGHSPFETPKPSSLIQRIVEVSTDPGSIVLDAFGGSGTTAHAVLAQNAKDNGGRSFILIELMDYAETTTAERVKRVISGYECKGKTSEELYSKKLTAANLPKFEKFYNEALDICRNNVERFDKITKPTIKDSTLTVVGEKVHTEKMPGLGGSFDFYELGEPIFDDGMLNPKVSTDVLREYIFYTETRKPLVRKQTEEEPYFLDRLNDTAYYFYYEPHKETALSIETIYQIITEKGRADKYIIYADVCYISKEKLKRLGIIFKKIPREIRKF